MMQLNKPIIMTAVMGKSDFSWANSLRKKYFPPERNFLSAHITLFHHLPPQALAEIKSALAEITGAYPAPEARLQRLIHLGRGVAYQLHSPDLLDMRMELAARFHGLLVAQDQQTPRLHITIQNKVEPAVAKELLTMLEAEFEPRPFIIHGLAIDYYMGGPWQRIQDYPFRG